VAETGKKLSPVVAAVTGLQFQPTAETMDRYWLLVITPALLPHQLKLFLHQRCGGVCRMQDVNGKLMAVASSVADIIT